LTERRTLLQEALVAIEKLQARLDASARAMHQPIAIVGVGCRYPGGIESPEGLWRVVRDGVDAVTEVPADRWDVDAFYDSDANAPGKMLTRRGGFLTQVDQFDAQFFGISPREALTLDPQQRLLLETSYEALERAGIAANRLNGSLTGVFVGITTSDYAQLLRRSGAGDGDVYSATGVALNAAAGRIAFNLGLQGPCVALDTACSSSLVAVHLACQSLRSGECNLALAGGVNVVLLPDAMVLFSKWGMLAPDGACKTFDAAANGFVRAEGCAVFALKRLADAVAAQDPILAVIRGSAVNSDGRSSGLTVPNGQAQRVVLRSSLATPQLEAAAVDYVEAHGTGTPLGDPIEVEALGAVMGRGRDPKHPLFIGSIKTNLGHTEAASGVAGLLKVVMALRHEVIPPHLHFSTPNPDIPWSDLPFIVPTKPVPWPRRAEPRRAGVGSFGFSGTNAHLIVEEAPLPPAAAPSGPEPVLVPLSARDDVALVATALRLADCLAVPDAPTLADVATTYASGRAEFSRRRAFVAASAAELERELREFAGNRPASGDNVRTRPAKIAFLFTGQGAQYAGMGRRLYETEPVFRAVLDRAAGILDGLLPRPLLQVLFATGEAESALGQTAYTQPALFALEYAVAELWRSWGITPAVVAGHSLGEYAAACVAGVFSFEQGLALVAERARLMQALPGGGGMAAVFAQEARVAPQVAAFGHGVSIAAVNGPEETVVAGESVALASLLQKLRDLGLASKVLDVSQAFHCASLDPMLDALERAAERVVHAPPRVALLSNLTGTLFAAGSGPDAGYWRRHAREPVRFAAGMKALKDAGVTLLLEVGPHPALLALAMRAVPDADWSTLASLRRGGDNRRDMLSAAAALYARGAPLQCEKVISQLAGRRISLPTYPFSRERHWFTAASAHAPREAVAGHPLLGVHSQLASQSGVHVWQRDISLATHRWLEDHRVQDAIIVPASAYIEMAIAAAAQVFGDGPVCVREIENLKPLILQKDIAHRLQTALRVDADGTAHFTVHGRPAANAESPWTGIMTARVSRIAPADVVADAALEKIRQRAVNELAGAAFYAALATKGNQWGPAFQGIQHLWRGAGEALGRVRVSSIVAAECPHFKFHPAVSDACGHALVATAPLEASDGALGGAFVGGGVGEVRFYKSPLGETLWAHARLRPDAAQGGNVLIGDLCIYDEGGALVSETRDVRLWYLDEPARARLLGVPPDWYYEMRWRAQPLAGDSRRRPKEGPWLVFADSAGIASHIEAVRRASGRDTILVTQAEQWSVGDHITLRAGHAEDYRRLFSVVDKPAAIVHLWSVDPPLADQSGDPLGGSALLGAESTLRLLHGILQAENAPRPRLWLVTAGAQAVADADCLDAPFGATLWGLGKSLSAEHAELWGGLIDLPAHLDPEREAQSIIREVEAATAEDKIAFRDAQRYVARLERTSFHGNADDKFSAHADGTYLVSGGLGGIGLAMTRWLAEHGARNFLLLGRTPMPQRQEWQGLDPTSIHGRRTTEILQIEALGARVEMAAVDVADRTALGACIDAYEAAGKPRVRGVIHAAGIVRFEALASQSIAALRESLAAKVAGAWHLHCLLADRVRDCFVLCSSTSAVLNSPLLGGYAAGNAFLDALAHHRRARGMPALSVNWGTWSEVGMAREAARRPGEQLLSGFGTISTAQGLAALGELLKVRATQTAVMPIDWPRFVNTYPAFALDPFLEFQVAAGSSNAPGPNSAPPTPQLLRGIGPEARAGVLLAYLRVETARVLGLAAERLDTEAPLSAMGFDSLMAVQLKNRVEADTGAVVPMIQFLQGLSVEQLISPVLEAVQALEVDPLTTVGEVAEVWEEGTL
jgi:acyl transferase domain-containing protein/acyl carrier protein